MSDREDLLALFARMGVVVDDEDVDAVVIASRDNQGYGGFYASFNFDPEGNFMHVGIWE